MSETIEIRNQFEQLQNRYKQYLPKVDPGLVHDLLLRQMENPDVVPMYMLEAFTKPGLNTEEVRSYIIGKTGMSPAIYDNGTHYVTNQKLTLDILKEISDSDDVIEVTGEYTGGLGSWGASHEHGDRHFPAERRAASPKATVAANAPNDKVEEVVERKVDKNDYRIAAYTAAGIVGAIALAGFIISGGFLPNANNPAVTGALTEPAALHGTVTGPGGLPAIGASVVAAEQTSGFTTNAFVSINGGYYYLDVQPGNYIVMVAYPDGTNQVVSDFEVARGSDHELNFSY
jgi:hypothetical protein